MKRYTFTIPTEIEPTRLLPLVKRMLPELPEYVIREAFAKRDVKVDGIRARKDQEARAGAKVELYTRHAEGAKQVDIFYEDENLLVVFKPIGVSCEADGKGGKTIAEWVCETLQKADPSATLPLMCHRLDNQTDGLMLLARNEHVQSELRAAFEKRQVHKAYTCLVRGAPKERHQWIRAYLVKDAARGRVRIADRPEPCAREIVTEYQVMEAGQVSRLRVTLHTGRTHQIRAQMAAIGHPLLGDDAYGDRGFNKEQGAKRLMLCATELGFHLESKLAYMNEKHFTIQPLF